MIPALTIFGSGSSETSPCHGCQCETCEEALKNNALRANSTYMYQSRNGTTLFLDYGTAVVSRYGMSHLDIAAILLTHTHSDHIIGLYTLRWSKQSIDLYYPDADIHQDFLPIVSKPKNLIIKRIKAFEPLFFGNIKVTPVPLYHTIATFGYVIEDDHYPVALLSDCKGLPDETEEFLSQYENLIALIDASVSPEYENEAHNNLDEAIEILGKFNLKLGILTHISHRNWTNAKI
ncbi:MAG: MBL fold metallo-hydrolase, partial [Candidatus Heimdallarchaeaceae archaeon]